MKKSIKYAGIAAATLLAVAPVAAPALSSNVTTVKADAGNADQSDVNKAITNFGNQFGDQDADEVTLPTDNATLALGETNAQTLTDFESKNGNKGIIKTPSSDLAALEDQGAQVYVEATDAKNVTYDGSVTKAASDLASAAKLDSQLPVKFTVYLRYKSLSDGSYTAWKSAATFNLNKSDTDELKSVNAKFTTPISVAKNSKVAATQLTNGANLSLTDQNGDSIATQAIALGTTYYYTYAAALNGNATTGVVSNTDIKDGEFKTAGTYYQRITYTAQTGSSLDSLIKEYQSDPSSYTIYVNGKQASSGYDFTTATGAKTITFVRAINVSDSESDWTTTDTTGVVTTKSDAAYYTLKDDNNNTVTNRALGKNTAWKTNAVRTDQNGNKQYRVGGSEWINANDVTFSDKATDNNGEGAYTDVKALNGKVTTAGPEGFYYPLYDDNGKMVTNRGVAGLTAWRTDKSAVNADGVTVYHVATGEWLQGTNVTYTAY